MADTTILLNGFSILNGANVTVSPNGGYLNEGSVTVTGGDLLFEPDDIILMTVIGADENEGVSSSSEITQIIVYDNAADYLNDAVKYTYDGNNPNQTGTIRGNNSGVGDTYLRINANRLTSDDPGAPDINQLFLAAGVDLTTVSQGGSLTIDQFQDNDYNDNNTIDGNSEEPADGIFTGGDLGNNTLITICFARGTLIDTPDGPRFVETLRAGDLVHTLDDGPQPIRWIGSNVVDGLGKNAPVRIKAGALGNLRDLWVSPNHRMLARGVHAELLFGQEDVLVSAKHLVDGQSISQIPCQTVWYYHFLLDAHQIVFAEGCPAESLHLGAQSLASVSDTGRAEILSLFPEMDQDAATRPLSRYALREFEAAALREVAS